MLQSRFQFRRRLPWMRPVSLAPSAPLHRQAGPLRLLPLPALFLILALPSFRPVHAAPSAIDVIRRMESKVRGTTSISRVLITIQRPRYTRKMLLDSWDDRRGNRSFIRILKPKKDRGITFLKRARNLWQYIPKIGKEIKIEGSLMQDSWMGSDFTNDDLVRSSSLIEDYTHVFTESPDPALYRIELKPKPTAPVVWSKIVLYVRKSGNLPVRQMFFDHRGRLKKQMEYYNYKSMGGRVIPTRYIMYTIRNGRKNSSTVMRFIRLRFNAPIASSIFSKSNLRR